MLQAREIQRDEPNVAEIFNVLPKEYASTMGMSERGAQQFFKRALNKPDLMRHFKQIGTRIRASRAWFDKVRTL